MADKDNLLDELKVLYWTYIKKRADQYVEKNLTGRLVIDFQRGQINAIFDQAVIAGVSSIIFYNDKVLDRGDSGRL